MDNVLLTLQEIIRQHLNEQADHIATGACKDYAEYTHNPGIIKGLAIAERELLDLNNKLEQA